MTSAARDLMDTGTPGPWYADRGYIAAGGIGHHNVGSTLDRRDATKAALSVNALPLVDALCKATKTHVKFAYVSRTMQPDRQTPYCRQCGRAWPCPTAIARDALEAALRGEGE